MKYRIVGNMILTNIEGHKEQILQEQQDMAYENLPDDVLQQWWEIRQREEKEYMSTVE